MIARAVPSAMTAFALAMAGMVHASAAVPQQAGAPATGSLAGVVISGVAPAVPVRNAVVEIRWGRDNTLAVRTDLDGRFEFRGLPAGDYRLTGSKVAYGPTEFGREAGAREGVRIALKAGEQLDGVTLVLRLGAVVTGRVINELPGRKHKEMPTGAAWCRGVRGPAFHLQLADGFSECRSSIRTFSTHPTPRLSA